MPKWQVEVEEVQVLGEDLEVGDLLLLRPKVSVWHDQKPHKIIKKVNNTLTLSPPRQKEDYVKVTEQRTTIFGNIKDVTRSEWKIVDEPEYKIEPDKIYAVEIRRKRPIIK